MRKLALILPLLLIANAGAQHMGPAPHFAGHFAGSHGASRPLSSAIPFFSDGFYSDAFYPSVYGAVPPVIIVQAAPAVDPAPEQLPAPAQPLLIELQGDRYVRLSGEDSSASQMIDSNVIGSSKAANTQAQPIAATIKTEVGEAPVAVLIFRDGRHEKISEYTIAGGVLYARGDYYTDGSGNRKFELSSLNLPETVAANRASGLNFRLPTAPNEVIVGP